MDKRAKQKEKTYNKILDITRKIYFDQGYIYTSTREISKKAKVSQGTIFLHFKTKEKLLEKVIVDQLQHHFDLIQETNPTIASLFQMIVDEEALLSRVLKDYPYLPVKFQEAFDQIRMIYKDSLFDLLKSKSSLNILSLFSIIDMVLALVFEDLWYSNGESMQGKVKKYYKLIDKYALKKSA